jgi:hypothetical protein
LKYSVRTRPLLPPLTIADICRGSVSWHTGVVEHATPFFINKL